MSGRRRSDGETAKPTTTSPRANADKAGAKSAKAGVRGPRQAPVRRAHPAGAPNASLRRASLGCVPT